MHILLVAAVVAGGVGRHVRQLAAGLTAGGHDVVVACPPGVAEQFDLAGTGAVVEPSQIGTGPVPVPGPRELGRLASSARRADVVHAHGLRAGAHAALAHHRGGRSALVVTSHNAPPAGAAGAVYRVLEQIVCRRADVVLGVSPDLVERARRRGAAEVGLAVVPADDTAVSGPEERRAARWALRTELGLPTDGGAPVILTAGRLSAQKRTGLLVQAYHQLLRGRPGPLPVLVVVGEGPQRQELERMTARGPGDVRMLGQRDDVPTLLAGADVAVSAAVWEGQPLFLQEALAAGAPVVATDVGGTGVVLGGAGLLVPGRGDVATALARSLGRVLDDPQLAEDLRGRSLARAAQLPSVHDAVEAALTVYRRLRPGA